MAMDPAIWMASGAVVTPENMTTAIATPKFSHPDLGQEKNDE